MNSLKCGTCRACYQITQLYTLEKTGLERMGGVVVFTCITCRYSFVAKDDDVTRKAQGRELNKTPGGDN